MITGICLIDETVEDDTNTTKSIAPGIVQAYDLPNQNFDSESEVIVDTSDQSLEELMSKMKSM
jgi:hypothetical protein